MRLKDVTRYDVQAKKTPGLQGKRSGVQAREVWETPGSANFNQYNCRREPSTRDIHLIRTTQTEKVPALLKKIVFLRLTVRAAL